MNDNYQSKSFIYNGTGNAYFNTRSIVGKICDVLYRNYSIRRNRKRKTTDNFTIEDLRDTWLVSVKIAFIETHTIEHLFSYWGIESKYWVQSWDVLPSSKLYIMLRLWIKKEEKDLQKNCSHSFITIPQISGIVCNKCGFNDITKKEIPKRLTNEELNEKTKITNRYCYVCGTNDSMRFAQHDIIDNTPLDTRSFHCFFCSEYGKYSDLLKEKPSNAEQLMKNAQRIKELEDERDDLADEIEDINKKIRKAHIDEDDYS